jgi:hypothetical protein
MITRLSAKLEDPSGTLNLEELPSGVFLVLELSREDASADTPIKTADRAYSVDQKVPTVTWKFFREQSWGG